MYRVEEEDEFKESQQVLEAEITVKVTLDKDIGLPSDLGELLKRMFEGDPMALSGASFKVKVIGTREAIEATKEKLRNITRRRKAGVKVNLSTKEDEEVPFDREAPPEQTTLNLEMSRGSRFTNLIS